MAPKYWMLTDRNVVGNGLGPGLAKMTFWVSQGGALDRLKNWEKVDENGFRRELLAAAETFPSFPEAQHEKQGHVTLFVHGYNNTWQQAVRRYAGLCRSLFDGPKGMGHCILFTWPSDGSPAAYLPDREDAQRAAPDLAFVLSELFDWLLKRQKEAAENPKKGCRAKTSLIAHSMGNYLLQKAMQQAWTRKNQPLLVSLINQLLMVAADVDNDLFGTGERVEKTDGDAIANLTYRVTALYTGRDSVLGVSAGLKHFGKRRLGRSGLDRTLPVPDNVWDVDCSSLLAAGEKEIHSAYFTSPGTLELMRQVLRGVDRLILRNCQVRPV